MIQKRDTMATLLNVLTLASAQELHKPWTWGTQLRSWTIGCPHPSIKHNFLATQVALYFVSGSVAVSD